jgi:chromate transporter
MSEQRAAAPTFNEAFAVWAKIGVLSFGGPAGQIALMHRVLVDERRWIGEDQFLRALNFCMPGPEAMQLATYVGWRLHGTFGGLSAGLLFVLPGAFVVLALSIAYALFGHVPLVEAAFVGIKAAVLIIVIEALLRVARRALRRAQDWIIAAAAFVGIFFFAVPFPLVIAAAALIGYALVDKRRQALSPTANTNPAQLTDTLRTAGLWLALWIVTSGLLALLFGRDHVFTDIAIFFSKLPVVTFGGAYSVLAYMAQQAVETYGWLSAGEMLDGLGLAEDHARPSDPRHRVCRIPRRLPPWRRTQDRLRTARRRDHAVGDLRALFPMDLRGSALR